jgi:hypothetical protein
VIVNFGFPELFSILRVDGEDIRVTIAKKHREARIALTRDRPTVTAPRTMLPPSNDQ